jgi:hypothetical protein
MVSTPDKGRRLMRRLAGERRDRRGFPGGSGDGRAGRRPLGRGDPRGQFPRPYHVPAGAPVQIGAGRRAGLGRNGANWQ